jgi:succinate-acetate transporter protein
VRKAGKIMFFAGLALGVLGVVTLVLHVVAPGAFPIPNALGWNLILGTVLFLGGILPFILGVVLWAVGAAQARSAIRPS